MKTPLVIILSIFVGILSSCGGGGGGSATLAIPQSTSPSAEFTPRSLSTSELASLGEIVSTNQKSDETLKELKDALEAIAGRTLSANEVNTFYRFITSIFSPTPPTPTDCEAGRILNEAGTACRLLTSADCVAKGQALNAEGTSCRALVPADCQTGQVLNHVGNACRALIATDCTANDQILSGNSCVTCSGENPARYGNVCGPTTQMCVAFNQILRGTVCAAPTDVECRSRNQRLNGDATVCRPLTNADCVAENKVLQHNSCVTAEAPDPTDASCRSENKRLNADATACRPLTIADCPTGQVVNTAGNVCRPITNIDCQATGQIINEAGNACRSLTNADCEADNKVINDVGNSCRPITNIDCQATGQLINEARNACRPLTNADCQAGQVANEAGNACRPITSTDCKATEDKIINEDGNACRALTEDEKVYATRIALEDERLIEYGKILAIKISIETGDETEVEGISWIKTRLDLRRRLYGLISPENRKKCRDKVLEREGSDYDICALVNSGISIRRTVIATFTVGVIECKIDYVNLDENGRVDVGFYFDRKQADFHSNIAYKSVDDACIRHFNGETAPLTPAELPDVRFAQPGDYFIWLAKAYPHGFLPFANLDYASGYYHYGLQYGMNLETANFGFRATDKGAYNAMFYKSLNAGNHAFFSYDKSEDSLMVLGLDTDTDFYGKGKVRFTVSSNIINPEKKFGIGYSTNIHNSEFVGVLEYRQDSAVNVGFKLDYNL